MPAISVSQWQMSCVRGLTAEAATLAPRARSSDIVTRLGRRRGTVSASARCLKRESDAPEYTTR